ncbi:hypothetical protein FMM05_20590 [Flavobacterium zepuense]|uniref:Uncharacterized protein n=1 Tax=Flavobacterium zepuense TaxID=2593302 RepID=A0A552US86_9FLAO|nr:hypothetical protein [Flavobacterium zepuense]TRW21089.1 hypothetical protein FMM05_20590 [Flavobacterium zepuense]
MKNLSFVLIAVLCLTGCTQKELTTEEAIQFLQKDGPYPRAAGHYIFCRDRAHAKKVLDKGLEQQGLVIVNRKLNIKEVLAKKPYIEFTEKAKPYFLSVSDGDRSDKIQQVRLADQE